MALPTTPSDPVSFSLGDWTFAQDGLALGDDVLGAPPRVRVPAASPSSQWTARISQ
jgi:hypothetical protein